MRIETDRENLSARGVINATGTWEGGITMTGRSAKQVANDPRVHLVGYGPSASTIGANRAAAAKDLMAFVGEEMT